MMKCASFNKVVSQALRHQPWAYGLELEDNGWVRVDQLMEGIAEAHRELSGLTAVDLFSMMQQPANQQRHQLLNQKIRALYGHSIVGLKLNLSSRRPPFVLYHGTNTACLPAILDQGLLPMARRHVHLSSDRRTSQKAALAKSQHPVLLGVFALNAHAQGVEFYKAQDQVWLSSQVPPEFIQVILSAPL